MGPPPSHSTGLQTGEAGVAAPDGVAAGWLTDDEAARLFEEEPAMLWGYFVEGAPATINANIETSSGIVNDCDAVLHSLVLEEGQSLQAFVDAALAQAQAQVEVPFVRNL